MFFDENGQPNDLYYRFVQAFSLYRGACDPEARLDVVGEPLSPIYGAQVQALAGPGVRFHGRSHRNRVRFDRRS